MNTGIYPAVNVLVVDDSAFMRTAITRMIESEPTLRVIGTAQTGMEAIEKVNSLRPDVVTLDIEMPGLNGLETLRRIMDESPRPVIMVSSLTQEGAEATVEALELGAFDCVPKQLSYVTLEIVKVRDELVGKIIAAAQSGSAVRKRISRAVLPLPSSSPYIGVPSVVAIGTSTGGPRALQEVLPMLPAELPVPVLIVQHMPVGFTGPFARRLNNACKIAVDEASEGIILARGHAYLAPAGFHMTVHRRSTNEVAIHISKTPENMLHVPSVDVMMDSVAEAYRSLAMGVIMTGIGADGVIGMRSIFQQGGLTIGQDEASCIVYGMPRSCAEQRILRRVLPLQGIPGAILSAVGFRSTPDRLKTQIPAEVHGVDTRK